MTTNPREVIEAVEHKCPKCGHMYYCGACGLQEEQQILLLVGEALKASRRGAGMLSREILKRIVEKGKYNDGVTE